MVLRSLAFIGGALLSNTNIHPEPTHSITNSAVSPQTIHGSSFADTPVSQRARIHIPQTIHGSSFAGTPVSRRARTHIPPRSYPPRMSREDEFSVDDSDLRFNPVFTANYFFNYVHYESEKNGNFMGYFMPEGGVSKGLVDCVLESSEIEAKDPRSIIGGQRVYLAHNGDFLRSNEIRDTASLKQIGAYDEATLLKGMRFEVLASEGCAPEVHVQNTVDPNAPIEDFKADDFFYHIENVDSLWKTVTANKKEWVDKYVIKTHLNPPSAEIREEHGALRLIFLQLPLTNAKGEVCTYDFTRVAVFLRRDSKKIISPTKVRGRRSHACPPHLMLFPGIGLSGLRE